MSQRPFILWLLGPTSSGKSTLAELLTLALRGREVPIIHFDGDEVRDFFGPGHGFAPADRQRVVATLVHLANKSREAGLNVVVSALTANPDARAYVLASIADLITGFVRCPIEVCAARDPKGLYAKANSGEIDTLIGANSEYLAPEDPDIVLDTEANDREALIDLLLTDLQRRGYLQNSES